jgi:hypothetical protein
VTVINWLSYWFQLVSETLLKFYKAIDNLKKGFQPRSNGWRYKDGEIIREEGRILR